MGRFYRVVGRAVFAAGFFAAAFFAAGFLVMGFFAATGVGQACALRSAVFIVARPAPVVVLPALLAMLCVVFLAVFWAASFIASAAMV